MKKSFLLVVFAAAAMTAFNQVKLDTTYNSSTALVKLENSGYKYYTVDWMLSQCQIYNTDHSLWKSIPLVVPTGDYLYNIQYLSETLFNPDNKIELVYTYYSYDTLKLYYTYTTRIINEDGAELLLVPGASYVNVVSTDTLESKMLVYVYDYSVSPYTVLTKIYALPGKPAPNGQHELFRGTPDGRAFPNPAKTAITIPYNVPEGERDCLIEVFDVRGKIVRSFRVDKTFHDLKLDVSGFDEGVYFYGIIAGGKKAGAGKFIVE